jgi:hypothetical protein
MALRIIHHERCFDGFASAALFARYFRECVRASARIEYAGARYTSRSGVDPALFLDGPDSENAIVDFKYSADPRVRWWYDHHASTFATSEDERHYETHRSTERVFDPEARSCASLIFRTHADRGAFTEAHFSDLVGWADRIDSGDFADPAEAVELASSALRIGLAIQGNADPVFATALIEEMQRSPLEEIERLPLVSQLLPIARTKHIRDIEAVRQQSTVEGNVLYFDVARHDAERIDRYIPFYLYPSIQYAVGVTRSPGGLKVSIAFNPWSPSPRSHDISEVCTTLAARVGIKGAGGHPTIGGIPFGAGDYATARETARWAVATLASREG